jgi:LysM repeat protein
MTKIKIVSLLSLLALLAALFGAPGSYVLAADPVVRVTPASNTVAVGNDVVVNITVQNVSNLFGAEFHLTFDPALLEVVDADPTKDGVQIGIGDFLSADFIAQNTVDNATGTVDFGLSQMSPNGPVSGSGTLATITFKGKANGNSSLAFTDVLLADSGGGQIAASAENGAVNVGGSVSPPPPQLTPTPTPTPTPTTPPSGPTPTPSPTSAPGTCAFQGHHTVRSGETLYAIGRAYATQPSKIAACNNVTNPSRLYVGMKLGIPVAPWSPIPAGPVAVAQFTPGEPAPTPPPTTQCRYYHTVSYGQTLTMIAARYGSNVWEIGRANSINNLNLIYPGQVLCIP